MMAISCSLVSRSSVLGTPTSLLKLPSVASTLNFSLSTARISSLVVVLPLVPVMAMTGMLNWRRCSRASSFNVCRQSSTTMSLEHNSLLAANSWSEANLDNAPVADRARSDGFVDSVVTVVFENDSRSSTIAQAHPFSKACSAKRLPSKLSPFSATKMLPLGQSRLSVVMPVDCWYRLYSCFMSIKIMCSVDDAKVRINCQ